ncbi:laccase 17 [Mycena rebaudengoi]|nr:laccase 17 [Mycena rebaudengoi]
MFSKLISSLAFLPFIVESVYAADVFVNIPVFNVNVAPDGFHRDAIQMGANPRLLVTAHKGDVLHLNVSNTLNNPNMRRSTAIASLEFGFSPIGPGSFYQYNFPVFNQTGTYWFHSHLSTHADTSLTFMTDDLDDPQKALWDVDDASTIITLEDWYHAPAEVLMAQFKVDGKEPVPDSGLVNGVGRYNGGPSIPWAVVNVVKGKKYRLRVVNIAGFAAFTFSIDGHTFDVIETDGIATAPLTVDSFKIHAAQRYSVVLNANQPVANYWINAPMEAKGSSATLDKDNVKAILRYAGAPIADPPSNFAVLKSNELQEFQLKTLINPGAPGGSAPADHVIDLNFGTAGNGEWEINGIVYTPPTLPTLLKIINGATTASDFTTPEHTFILAPNEVVELRIHGSANGITHPFHLHGHAFDVVQSSQGPVNYIDPPRRDVIGVEAGGVIIRFRADNPGPWFLHCHIDWHLEAGLAVVFAESPAAQRSGSQSQIISPQWLDLCPAYNALPAALQ